MEVIRKLVLPLAAAVLICAPASGASEFRGLYVDAFHPGIKTHEQVVQMVNAAKAANFNALIVQVRKRGDAYWSSAIEPRAADIAPEYDPLAGVITQAHAAGLEVHAWLSVYEISHQSYTNASTHICRAHPDWLLSTSDGRTVLEHGKVYADPGVPAVQAHLVSLVKEIAARYEIDGIHLDNAWYPGPGSGYNSTAVSLFNQETGATGAPRWDDPAWRKWRRERITALVRAVKDALSSVRPSATLSASVLFSKPSLAAAHVLQDWGVWTSEGLVDFAVPLLYQNGDPMATNAARALESAYARHVYVGIGGFRITGTKAQEQIAAARTAGAKGVTLFSYHYLGPNSGQTETAKMSDLSATVFSEAASRPTMPWR